MKIEPHLEAILAQVELRVLYGPQAGSRLPLSPGSYLLGTGDECAVMLAGPRMQESHASLEFDGETPSVTPIDGNVFDAQGNELQATLALRLGMPIELGGVWITIDYVDSTWPDPEEVAAIAGLASPQQLPQVDLPVADATAATERSAAASGNKVRWAWLATSMPIAIVALLGVAAFGMTAWLLHSQPPGSGATARADEQRPSSSTSALQEALARVAPGQDIRVTQNVDGNLQVAGYARDPASRDKIFAAIRKHDSAATIKVHVDSELLDAARKVVERQADPRKMKVTVTSVANGQAELAGAVSSASVRESLAAHIRTEVPAIISMSGTLMTSEDLSSLLQDRIMTSGLIGKLQIVERQPEFIVRGRLVEPDIMKWERLLTDFSREYASLLPIRATIQMLLRKPPVDVQMVVGGSMPFIVTEAGQRIGRGGDANGHTLSSVGEQEVVFEGNERFKIAR